MCDGRHRCTVYGNAMAEDRAPPMADRSGERAMSLRSVSPHFVSLAIILGGCAGSMGTIHSDQPPPPPITSFDGSYRTTIRITNTRATEGTIWCNTSGQSVVTVAN